MEKFGIFELLDALSAATARETLPENEEEETKSSEKQSPSVCDAAFFAPVYAVSPAEKASPPSGAASGDAVHSSAAEPREPNSSADENSAQRKTKSSSMEADALKGFYARHNAVAKKATQRKD